ncbi:MAG TPA: sulfite exporter TauE/SafE family protein [Lachnospiraceae bacterium]|nr:sulfite exporter TauE/SafE family protein [Lachnospiraceae bacterium]
MLELVIIAAANALIGGMIGMTGIAGFLLPLLYAGYLGMHVTEALALSFLAFLISGIIGAWNYWKEGHLDVRFGWQIGAGSFVGAIVGVLLNSLIPETTVRQILYLVVLLSGISILLRKEPKEEQKKNILEGRPGMILLLGAVTGAVCSLSGAGGPILVMPLLVVCGMEVRTAVGVALFDSIFIAIPAGAGYFLQTDMWTLLPMMGTAGIFHALGVQIGSKNAGRIPQQLLKKGVAVGSILIAIWKLNIF